VASFDDLKFNSDGYISRARVEFTNGYSASVVRGIGTYGSEDGLYELAVLHGGEGIVYDTPITSDVEGHLSPDAVTSLLEQIEALPARVSA
jgi:hypothetical protein